VGSSSFSWLGERHPEGQDYCILGSVILLYFSKRDSQIPCLVLNIVLILVSRVVRV
jgi:hypothetical protein